MSNYVVPPSPVATVAVAGTAARYPVHRIYCVGRNYADHVREMGADPRSEPPIFFMKPADAVIASGTEVPYPSRTKNFHYEAELVVALGRAGRATTRESAESFVYGYAVGIDFTRRDLQAEAREGRRPWDVAKGFDHSAGIGPIQPLGSGAPRTTGRIRLTQNGVTRQDADLADMIWSVAEVIRELSTYFELAPGDLIYTGTPAGVGPLGIGDEVVATIDGLGETRHRIGAPR